LILAGIKPVDQTTIPANYNSTEQGLSYFFPFFLF
jgi:hypothetical protein